ncbi:acetylxylan esterase [Micromonospora lupini]|uniref:acetylxylan esterase n=1 Tax=Micromonospora lupini TaxID=285679 RepID=UPI0022511C8B|nr:acetylxylan esterase [Micromonospora lupini]MCX5070415.1 acetylxylan esterase [Micromonospora lupini]
MALFDMPEDLLLSYRPAVAEPEDFDSFWTATLQDARAHQLNLTVTPVDNGLAVIDTFDVTFAGYDGNPVKAWLHLPVTRTGPLPAVVEYVGYGGGRGLPHERPLWAMAGYAHFIMDTRGQGSKGPKGDTPDPDLAGDPASAGFTTRGIASPETYYYRRVFTDAVRAIDAVRRLSTVDPSRVAVAGTSQGGGIATAAAGLASDLVAVMPDVPFLANFPRALTITDASPYAEITGYLKVHRDKREQVMRTLSYFDTVNHAKRASASALYSVGLMDQACPPSTVYASYNHYAGPKQIRVYPFNGHEGGGAFHEAEKLRFAAKPLSG